MSLTKRMTAELLGTAWLVLGGCGSAVIAAAFPNVGIGLTGVSLAFGLTVITMAYAIGPVSGCHLNPAVTLGLAVAGRHPWKEVLTYVAAQLIGGLLGGYVLYLIASGAPGFAPGDFAANGYGEHSPGHYGLLSAFICETVMTFGFLTVILGSTAKKDAAGFAPLAIGLWQTIYH